MQYPTELEWQLLFTGNETDLKAYALANQELLKTYGMDDVAEDPNSTVQEKIQLLLAAVHSVVVDWREYDDEIVRLFAARLPEETIDVKESDNGLLVTYNRVEHVIALSMSPNDRYITIRGFQEIVGAKYEIRLFEHSYFSDTHEFLILPRYVWDRLETEYGEQVGKVFRVVDSELDFP